MGTRVAAILERKGTAVITIAAQATIADAARSIAQHGVGALVVSADGSQVEGVVSERDIVQRLADAGADCLQESVAEIMTVDVTTCTRDQTADELMQTMTDSRIRHLPVLEDGRLTGIVSIGDVVKSRMDELETKAESLQHYVTGSSY